MGEHSKIEWTEATWNPTVGCTMVSPGCAHCYAQTMARRLQAMGMRGYEGVVDEHGKWTGRVNFVEEAILIPVRRKKPTSFFVDSMSDLFHESVPNKWVDAVIVAMAFTYDHTGEMREVEPGHTTSIHTQRHVYQVLTKRPERMAEYFQKLDALDFDAFHERFSYIAGALAIRKNPNCPLPGNAFLVVMKWVGHGRPGLWLGSSVENQEQADKRIPALLKCPAAVRFLSVEPLLGGIRINPKHLGVCEGCDCTKAACPKGMDFKKCCPDCRHSKPSIGWVIIGGESGQGARPCNIEWIRDIVRQCNAAGVACFVKQDSGPKPGMQGRIPDEIWKLKEFPNALQRS